MSTITERKRRRPRSPCDVEEATGGNDNDDDGDSYSSTDDVSSKEEPSWRAHSDDSDTTDLKNDSIENDVDGDTSDDGSDENDGSDNDINDQFSDNAFN
jgi:hypothetical protein